MRFYVELSYEEPDVVAMGKLYPIYLIENGKSTWAISENDAVETFTGVDDLGHPISLWEDETGYVVTL